MATSGKGQRRLQNLLGTSIIVVLAVLGGMLWYHQQQDELLPQIIEKLPENVDLGLDHVHYSQSEDGTTRWVLDAERASYQNSEEELALTGVTMTFFDAGSFGELSLRADHGVLRQKKQKIEVRGDVQIIAGSGERFFSNVLVYDMEKRQIRTSEAVKMIGRGLELTGVGMELALDTGKMQILSDVRALLEENAFKGDAK